MVLSMGLLVVAAILPLVPTYIDAHLSRIFHIFCDLATIKTSCRLGELESRLGSVRSLSTTVQAYE